MGAIFGIGDRADIPRSTQRYLKEQEIKDKKEREAAQKAREERLARDARYAVVGADGITGNLLSAANYLSARAQGDTTLSQESLLNLGGKLG